MIQTIVSNCFKNYCERSVILCNSCILGQTLWEPLPYYTRTELYDFVFNYTKFSHLFFSLDRNPRARACLARLASGRASSRASVQDDHPDASHTTSFLNSRGNRTAISALPWTQRAISSSSVYRSVSTDRHGVLLLFVIYAALSSGSRQRSYGPFESIRRLYIRSFFLSRPPSTSVGIDIAILREFHARSGCSSRFSSSSDATVSEELWLWRNQSPWRFASLVR